MSVKKSKKVIKTVVKVVWWVLIIAIALMTVNIISAKMKGKVPAVFGYSVIHIITDSMEDLIPEDSYILIKKCDPKTLKKGDVICFYSEDPLIYGFPNTHSIYEEPIQTEGGLEFVTKGENNLVADAIRVKESKVIGVMVKKLPFITGVFQALSGKGFMFFMIIVQVLIVGMFVYSAIIKAKNEEE